MKWGTGPTDAEGCNPGLSGLSGLFDLRDPVREIVVGGDPGDFAVADFKKAAGGKLVGLPFGFRQTLIVVQVGTGDDEFGPGCQPASENSSRISDSRSL